MEINIGSKIHEVLLSRKMSKSEFAKKINKSRENAYSIFRRKSIDTDLLVKISEVLDHNFFQYYVMGSESEKLKSKLDTVKNLSIYLDNVIKCLE